MSCRRSFLAGCITAAAAALATRAARAGEAPTAPDDLYLPPPGVSSRNDLYLPGSQPPGLPATPDLVEHVDAMFAVQEGARGPKIRILFEFSCPRSPELHARVARMLDRARFEWIPIPPVRGAADSPAAALFAPGAGPETLKDVFAGRPAAPPSDPDPARRQGALFAERIGPEIYRESNRPFATPTLVYRGRDGEARIVRGLPDLGTLRAIVASAT